MLTRIVFMGSPEFAIPTLNALVKDYEVVGVVTQPDRPAGRGQVLTPPPVKLLAQELNLPIIQPRRLREAEAMEKLISWRPDVIVVAAFGQILRPDVLNLTEFGCINVHASLLPHWRGAAPIQAAILNGDEITGITIMKMDQGVDTGPILSQEAILVDKDDNSLTLGKKLSELGATLLLKTLPGYLARTIIPVPQDETLATYAKMVKKEDGELVATSPGLNLVYKVRAYNPWPGAFIKWKETILKIHDAYYLPANEISEEFLKHSPGKHVIYQGRPAIRTSDGLFIIKSLQPPGKKVMPGKAFLQGVKDWQTNSEI